MPFASHEAPEHNSSSVIPAAQNQSGSHTLATHRQSGSSTLAMQNQSGSAPASEQAAELEWTVHLIKKRPAAAWRIAVCFLATLAFGTVVFGSVIPALLLGTALLLSVSEYWLPVRYTLGPSGARSRWGLVTLEMPWSDVRHAYLTDEGIKLSPLTVPGSRMEGLRGVFLRFGDNKDLVIETVRALRERDKKI